MNRGELRQELYDLGHEYLEREPGRANRFLDQAASDVIMGERWPQRTVVDEVVEQTPLLTLGTISQAWNSQGTVLEPTTQEDINDSYGAGDRPLGVPCLYWVEGNRLFWTWPQLAGGDSIMVRHASKGPWQDGLGRYNQAPSDNAEVIGDGTFDEVVLMGARMRALEDTDEDNLRDQVGARYESTLVELRFQELNIVGDEPQRIKQTMDWY